MKGKEGTGHPGGPDAKSGRYWSRSGLCPSGEKAFFADDRLCECIARAILSRRICHTLGSS